MLFDNLYRPTAIARCTKTIGQFCSNFLFSSLFITKCQLFLKKKKDLSFKMTFLAKKPAYYVKIIDRFKYDLATFFDSNIAECLASLQKSVDKQQREIKGKLDSSTLREVKYKWIEQEVRNRKNVHYNLVDYYLKVKAYTEAKFTES